MIINIDNMLIVLAKMLISMDTSTIMGIKPIDFNHLSKYNIVEVNISNKQIVQVTMLKLVHKRAIVCVKILNLTNQENTNKIK